MINNLLLIEWVKIPRQNVANAEKELFSDHAEKAIQARLIITLNNYLNIYMTIAPSQYDTKH